MSTFKIYRQHDQMDCGPTCLRMIAKHHGRNYTLETLRRKSGINREGVSLLGMIAELISVHNSRQISGQNSIFRPTTYLYCYQLY